MRLLQSFHRDKMARRVALQTWSGTEYITMKIFEASAGAWNMRPAFAGTMWRMTPGAETPGKWYLSRDISDKTNHRIVSCSSHLCLPGPIPLRTAIPSPPRIHLFARIFLYPVRTRYFSSSEIYEI